MTDTICFRVADVYRQVADYVACLNERQQDLTQKQKYNVFFMPGTPDLQITYGSHAIHSIDFMDVGPGLIKGDETYNHTFPGLNILDFTASPENIVDGLIERLKGFGFQETISQRLLVYLPSK